MSVDDARSSVTGSLDLVCILIYLQAAKFNVRVIRKS